MADLEPLTQALADRYRIEGEIGRGGMATVYLAEDLKHHRKVAVRVMAPELTATLGPDRFLREVEISARLDHPHIIPLEEGDPERAAYYWRRSAALWVDADPEFQPRVEAALEAAERLRAGTEDSTDSG